MREAVWQALAIILGGAGLALLTLIWTEVRRIAALPDRVDAIERENRKAHGDLWTAINDLKAEVQRWAR